MNFHDILQTLPAALAPASGKGGPPFSDAVSAAVIAAALGFLGKFALQIIRHFHKVQATRSMVYAQLHRVLELTRGHLKWIEGEDRNYMWIPLIASNLPSLETLKHYDILSPKEIYEITSFFYTYHEQVGYLLGDSHFESKQDDRWGKPVIYPPDAAFPAPTLGYDFSQADPKDWLRTSFINIGKRARRARNAVGDKIMASLSLDLYMRQLIIEHRRSDLNDDPVPKPERRP